MVALDEYCIQLWKNLIQFVKSMPEISQNTDFVVAIIDDENNAIGRIMVNFMITWSNGTKPHSGTGPAGAAKPFHLCGS